MRIMIGVFALIAWACVHKPNEDVQGPADVKRLMTDEHYLEAMKTRSEAPAACEDKVLYRVTASAYPEFNQTVVAQMNGIGNCSLAKAPIQNTDDPEDYSWEAYRLSSNMKTGRSQSEYIGRAFLFDKNHILIRLNQDMKSYASDANFFPKDLQDRVILIFAGKGLKNMMRPDFEAILGRTQEYNEELVQKIKFAASPVRTGIQRPLP